MKMEGIMRDHKRNNITIKYILKFLSYKLVK